LSEISIVSKRFWNSPTLMTWLSYSTKALSLFGVLRLLLKKFTPGDIEIWYLFATIISLQSIADFGFRQTFTRLISYAFGGAGDITVFTADSYNSIENNNGLNYSLLNKIYSTMKQIYQWQTALLFVIMILLGSWSILRPIKDTSNIHAAWLSWAVVVLVSCVNFYGKIYMNFLEGIYKIATVRRVETLTSIGSIATSITVLIFCPSLLNLVIANQVWVLINVFRDWYLCKTVENKLYQKISTVLPFDRQFFKRIWHPAWRSGISGLMSVGLTNLTGLVYAQVGDSASVASYLLALRIINQIKEISMAPFYSKLPLMAMLRVKNDLKSLTEVAKRGMFLSHLVFALGVIAVGLSSTYLLHILHSQISFVNQWMWLLLGFAFFVHRFGAMHIQIYSTTNHIISHVADGVSGLIYILSSIILIKYIGIYAVPVGMLLGYFGFYAWYAARYSYKSLNVFSLNFEFRTSLLPLLLLLTYFIILLLQTAK